MNLFKSLAVGAALACTSAFAAPISFSECPAIGADSSGCEFLITVTAVSASGAATATSVAVSNPDQGPYDGSDDTLVGVLNSSSSTLLSLSLSSTLDIFGFDGDGACTYITCTGATDPSGYAPAGVTYSGVNAAFTAGTVNFSPGVAAGGSQWFSLEDALTVSSIVTPGSVPEPSSFVLVALGLLGGIVVSVRRRRRITE